MVHLFLRRVGYAVHVLSYMVKVMPRERLTTAPELSEWMRGLWPGTSETYLCTVIRRLARGGILDSQRGFSGGYSLARPAKEISLRDVVEVLDEAEPSRCPLTPSGECPLQGRCDNFNNMCGLQEQWLDSLAKISIAEVAGRMAADVPKSASE